MTRAIQHVKSRKGTTIVEMMVAFGVFSIFITTAIGGFVYALRYQKLSMLMLEANESTGLALEEIARDIRTAQPETIAASGGSLSFTDDKGRAVSYALQGSVLTKNGDPITSEDPSIAIQSFAVSRWENANTKIPPRVLINIAVAVNYRGMQPITTNLQTTVSPRIYYHFNSSM